MKTTQAIQAAKRRSMQSMFIVALSELFPVNLGTLEHIVLLCTVCVGDVITSQCQIRAHTFQWERRCVRIIARQACQFLPDCYGFTG